MYTVYILEYNSKKTTHYRKTKKNEAEREREKMATILFLKYRTEGGGVHFHNRIERYAQELHAPAKKVGRKRTDTIIDATSSRHIPTKHDLKASTPPPIKQHNKTNQLYVRRAKLYENHKG